MIPDADERIGKLNNFLQLLDEWEKTHSDVVRTRINKTKNAVQREVIEAGCLYTMTISPPPAVGGMILQNVNPFDMIFDRVFLHSLNSHISDMINQTIGVIEERRNLPDDEEIRNEPKIAYQVQKGYVGGGFN